MAKASLIPAWKRMVAFIIDVLVIEFLLLYPFTRIAKEAFGSADFSTAIISSAGIGIIFAAALIYLLYFTLLEYSVGQTIGKILMKCTSVNMKNKQMNFWQALGRNLFIIPFVPFIFLWVLDPIFIILKKRSLSEIFTKTKTIEGEKWLEK